MPVSILGIFNVSDGPISELLQLWDFANIDPTMSYVVRSACGTTSEPVKVHSSLLLSIDVDVSEYAFLCAYPLTALAHNDNNEIIYMTVLGLQNKMINAAAIMSSTFAIEDNALTAKTVVKGFGFLGKGLFYLCFLKHNCRDGRLIKGCQAFTFLIYRSVVSMKIHVRFRSKENLLFLVQILYASTIG